jgi:hypothetical protein
MTFARQTVMGVREQIGAGLGVIAAPVVSAITKLRHTRMFHPRGHVFLGLSDPVAGPFPEVSEALSGRVLARISAALWRGGWEHLDVLGFALRIRHDDEEGDFDEVPRAGDQDLLTATIRSPLTMLASPFFTDASDFVGNTYWAVSPFELGDVRFELRLVPVDPPTNQDGSREERLRRAVEEHRAAWWLQARRTLTLGWHTVTLIELEQPHEIDQAALAFDPFRGALRPVGLVHAIRRAVYAAGQAARPVSS